jgi:nicotinate-nucleotide adenylyltransferase
MFKYLSLLRSRKRASRNANKGLKRIGIYGGKFDPIHLGHLMCAELTAMSSTSTRCCLSHLPIRPTKRPVSRLPVSVTRWYKRLAHPIVISKPVISRCNAKVPPTHSTLFAPSRERYGPSVELCLLISSSISTPDFDWNITHWMHSDELFASVRLLVFARQGHSIETTRQWGQAIATTHGARLDYLDFCPTPPVSSTMLRERVSKDKSIWYMVLPEVWEVIRRRRLYGCVTPSRGTHLQKLMRRLSFTAKRYLDIVLRRFRSL